MNVSESRLDGHVVVAPTGRLDSASATAFDRHLTSVIQRGDTRLVIDLTGLEYISSVGLSVLLAAAKKIKAANGRLVLVGLNDRIRLVFEMSGFLRLFPVFPTVANAVAG
jgi:anti-anti-sigma factor